MKTGGGRGSKSGGGRGRSGGGSRSGGGGRTNRDIASSSHSSNPSSINETSSHSQHSQHSLPSQYTPSTLPQYSRQPSPQPQLRGFQQQLHSQMQQPPPPHVHVPMYQQPGHPNPGFQPPILNPGYQPPLQNPAYQPSIQNPGYQQPAPHNPVYQQPPPHNPGYQPPPHIPEHQPPPPQNQENPHQDFQQQLDDLLALPGRQHLPMLSPHQIPNTQTTWFGRDKGKLSRVISGILRRKFDGPYFSWKATPLNIRERYFRSFARKYNWDLGITELVREGFLKIAKKRIKGIVSQAKRNGEQPIWIKPTLWKEMWEHWDTPEAVEKSQNASQARNSDRDGLGVHKHLSGQKSYLQIQQELEEKLGRPVSLGEVFVATHTKADGSFVDQKAKQVVETYEKNLEEVISQMEVDGPDATDHSSPDSTYATIPVQDKNDIFLKCTVTDAKGTPYGLGSLSEIISKGKRKASDPNSTPTSLLEIQEQLEVARRKLADQEEENARRVREDARRVREDARRVREDARRDEEQRNAQNRISTLEMLVSYLKSSDPGVAEFMASQAPTHAPFAPAANNSTPATAVNVNPPAPTTSGATSPATSPITSPAIPPTTSPLSASTSRT